LTIYYRLRRGAHLPAFNAGELYSFLRRDNVEGYIFLELMGKPRCVPERDFERIEGEGSSLLPAPKDISRE